MPAIKIAEFLKTEGQPSLNISVTKAENGLVMTMNGPGAHKQAVAEVDTPAEAKAAVKQFIEGCFE